MNHLHLWNRRPATLLAIAAALIFALLPLDTAGAHQGQHGRSPRSASSGHGHGHHGTGKATATASAT